MSFPPVSSKLRRGERKREPRQLNKTWIPDRVRNDREQRGFIALISVIIISAILLILSSFVATSSFFTRFNVLDYENKKVSVGLAEACAQEAMVNLAKYSLNYPSLIPATGLCVSVNGTDTCDGSDQRKVCKICSVSGIVPSGPFTILTRAVYNRAYTDLVVKVTPIVGNFHVDYWDEEPPFNVGYIWSNCNLP